MSAPAVTSELPVPAAPPSPARGDGIDRAAAFTLTSSHFGVDLAQGAVPALLPFVIDELGLTYAVAATLVLAISVSSSVLTPVFGLAADKRAMPWLVPLGALLAATGIGLASFAHAYWALLAALGVCGLGVAAYHPEAMRLAAWASGKKRATGMSIFSVGGTAGFAAAPAMAAWLMHQFGRPGLMALAIPGVAMAGWSWRQQDHLRGLQPHVSVRSGTAHARDRWDRFAWLGAAVSVRSIAVAGLSTFVPLYIVQRLGATPAAGASALSVFLGAGVVGNLTGGAIADRVGRVRLAQVSLALTTALLVPLLVAPSVLWAYAVLAVAGYAIFAPFSAMTVLGQSLLPNRIGTASGVTVGLAVTIGGAAAPVLGAIADRFGLRAMLAGLVCFPMIAAALLLAIPRERGRAIAEGDA